MIGLADPSRPLHVGALLGNTPEMLRSMAAAALGGYVLCGINTTRRGAGLLADIRRSDCQLLLINPDHARAARRAGSLGCHGDRRDVARLPRRGRYGARAGAAPRGRRHRSADADLHLGHERRSQGGSVRTRDGGAERQQSGSPTRRHARRRVLPVDAAVPLQRSGRRLVGGGLQWRDDGARQVLGVGLPRRHSTLRGHVHELRRQAAGVGAEHRRSSRTTPTTRCASRSATRPPTATSSNSPRRFGCRVMDGFGSSEFAVIVVREDGTPPGSIGKGWDGVAIYHADPVTECATAVFDETGALANFDDAVGELVNTTGGGAFGGYYNDPDATNERMRHGMYWSGDLAYRDADGWIYLAGTHRRLDARRRREPGCRTDRTHSAETASDQPGRRCTRCRTPRVGDQVMAAVVLKDDGVLTPDRVRSVPGRAAGPVAEGLAPVRAHQRRPAADRHQQDPQARAHQGRRDGRRGSAVGEARPGTLVCGRLGCASVGVGVITERVGPPNFPSQSTERCRGTGRPGRFGVGRRSRRQVRPAPVSVRRQRTPSSPAAAP